MHFRRALVLVISLAAACTRPSETGTPPLVTTELAVGSLPSPCPATGCPPGSFCDLGANRCVAGCVFDAECGELESCQGRQCTGCPGSTANCDREASDACETDLSSDDSSCGSCGQGCDWDRACMGGACECAEGRLECAGACVDGQTDLRHCGACDRACDAPDHGTTACVAGMCQAACDVGYHLCGDICASSDDAATCGGRCQPCPTPAHGTAICDGENCGVSCDPGYVVCEYGRACCESCTSAGCPWSSWCNTKTEICEKGCERHEQCAKDEFCLKSEHTCVKTVDLSCPEDYYSIGYCPGARKNKNFCVHRRYPQGTKFVAETPCPEWTTERGSYYCFGKSSVCIPND